MANIYDKAYDLEKAIRESDEFSQLKGAYEAVMADPEAKELFDAFRSTQLQLQEKQMKGEDITEEEVNIAQQVVEKVKEHQDISVLMDQEQRLNVVINDVSAIVTKPLEELYGDQNKQN